MTASTTDSASTSVQTTAAERKAAATTRAAYLGFAGILVAVVFVVVETVVGGLASWTATIAAPLLAVTASLAIGCWRGVISLFVRAPRARRRGRGYRNSERDGSNGVLRGRVAYARGASEAMRVELVERGREVQGKGGWQHTWTEESRTLTARPFYLVQADGRRIRVEAEARTSQLFDTLEKQVTLLTSEETPRRTRTARLDRDEEVWIVGALAEGHDPEATSDAAAAYRENARPVGRVLRAAPTLLVSTVSLVDHFTSRAWLHRRQGLFALLLLVLPLMIVHRFADRITGHTAVGVVQKVLEVRSGKTNQLVGYVAEVDVDGVEWPSEVVESRPAIGAPYELRLGKSSSNDGPTFHATTGELFASVLVLGLTVLVAAVARFRALRSLPWFRSRGSFVESGRGRLDREPPVSSR